MQMICKALGVVGLMWACCAAGEAPPVVIPDGTSMGNSPRELMQATVNAMGQSRDGLLAHDAGRETQESQKRAIEALDRLIEVNKMVIYQPPSTQPAPEGTQRRPRFVIGPKIVTDGPGAASDADLPPAPGDGQPGGVSGSPDSLPNGSTSGHGGAGGPVMFGAHGPSVNGVVWFDLPLAQRAAVLNSVQDSALKSYAAKVAKYYQTLAEISRGNGTSGTVR